MFDDLLEVLQLFDGQKLTFKLTFCQNITDREDFDGCRGLSPPKAPQKAQIAKKQPISTIKSAASPINSCGGSSWIDSGSVGLSGLLLWVQRRCESSVRIRVSFTCLLVSAVHPPGVGCITLTCVANSRSSGSVQSVWASCPARPNLKVPSALMQTRCTLKSASKKFAVHQYASPRSD